MSNISSKRINKNSFLWVLRKNKKRLPVIGIICLISMVSSYLGVVFSLGTKSVIDTAISQDMGAFKNATIYLAVLILTTLILGLVNTHLNDKLSVDLDRDMKMNLMHIILRGDYQALSKYHSGDLVHRLNADISTVNGGLTSIFVTLCSFAVQMVSVIIVLGTISWQFTLIILCTALVLGGGTLIFQQLIKNLHKQINDASGKISGFLQEVIERLLIVQALDVGQEMEAKTDDLLERRWQIQRKRKNLGLVSMGTMSILGYVISFATLVWCANKMFHGEMSFGTLTATTQLASRLQAPIYTLPAVLRTLISMTASAERLMEIEEVPQEDKSSEVDLPELYSSMKSINASDLCFSYDRDLVLKNLDFEIPKGGLTVIVGQSGSGKSTLLRLLLSIYKPNSGELTLKCDNGDVVALSRDTRKLFTYAPQGNLLLSGTLRENLLLAKPTATEEEINEAVRISCIEDYLPTLPNGIDTYIGENGSGLSEGQAQRVSLARAILSGAPILLLDEVTSALDQETERRVLERIRAIDDRTCIVVTHRPAILELADVTLSIVDGQMVKVSNGF
ncbi:MAG: ABC transporter ATP-binding protein/permease [Saccharofermentans sp.]|nr:ABC transporter ATP-binding protein/permease [Saccharofermentans sp.]